MPLKCRQIQANVKLIERIKFRFSRESLNNIPLCIKNFHWIKHWTMNIHSFYWTKYKIFEHLLQSVFFFLWYILAFKMHSFPVFRRSVDFCCVWFWLLIFSIIIKIMCNFEQKICSLKIFAIERVFFISLKKQILFNHYNFQCWSISLHFFRSKHFSYFKQNIFYSKTVYSSMNSLMCNATYW